MQVYFEIKDQELRKALNDAIKNAPERVKRAVKDSTLLMWNKQRLGAPVWRGDLVRKMSFKVSGFTGIVGAGAKYAEWVHEGTKPHWIGKKIYKDKDSAFSKWAIEHGMSPYVLARSIARKGTRPRPWLKNAFEANQGQVINIFKEATKDIVRGITK